MFHLKVTGFCCLWSVGSVKAIGAWRERVQMPSFVPTFRPSSSVLDRPCRFATAGGFTSRFTDVRNALPYANLDFSCSWIWVSFQVCCGGSARPTFALQFTIWSSTVEVVRYKTWSAYGIKGVNRCELSSELRWIHITKVWSEPTISKRELRRPQLSTVERGADLKFFTSDAALSQRLG